ncbi:acetylornithine deacetylase [Octadecabacter temperatus]|uniref:Acetylornithine deacetylase n=1 Tax=Octadecabacter temperatus TaxID=1458307 RepID=A0A0K0Y5G1_9RHOB|nr:acetylornithine deacetylase [Octadecabacter temperatus]AKS46116.1 Acetylornithine deacetylase [Octadecabacter temperatus]SIO07792.1 acetylornithine deacetylase [Octadecabacter temperatus]
MTNIARTLELLDKLVAFPTVSCDSNLDLIDWVEDLLKSAGFEVVRIWSPDRSKAGLFARIGPDVDGGVCLSAHTDVVPVDGQTWTRPPFELTDEGDRVFGRGTTDMKGFLASALALAQRVGASSLSAPLSLSISYDEEIGCVGIRQMMPELKKKVGKPRLVIVGEPTSMKVATGHKGKAAFKVTCHGQAGHSALAPQFVNAIHVAADFIHQTRDLQGKLAAGPQDAAYSVPYSTVHVGKIHGGRALNIVPDSAELDMEIRHLAQTPARELQQDIEDIAQRVSDAYPAASPVTVDPINAYPGLQTDPSEAAVVWATKLAGGCGTTKVPFGTEAGFFADLGLTTVVIGPGDMASDGHKPDEGLRKGDLVACDKMMDNIFKENRS